MRPHTSLGGKVVRSCPNQLWKVHAVGGCPSLAMCGNDSFYYDVRTRELLTKAACRRVHLGEQTERALAGANARDSVDQ